MNSVGCKNKSFPGQFTPVCRSIFPSTNRVQWLNRFQSLFIHHRTNLWKKLLSPKEAIPKDCSLTLAMCCHSHLLEPSLQRWKVRSSYLRRISGLTSHENNVR